jgi:hypothetical protein
VFLPVSGRQRNLRNSRTRDWSASGSITETSLAMTNDNGVATERYYLITGAVGVGEGLGRLFVRGLLGRGAGVCLVTRQARAASAREP